MKLADQAVRYFDNHTMLPHRLVIPEVIRKAWGATNGHLWKPVLEDTRMAIARSVVEEQRKKES